MQTDMATLSSLIDVNFILINRIFVLTFTLLFFSSALVICRARGQAVHNRISMPIKLSLFGFLLLYGEMSLTAIPGYRMLLEGLLTIVVMLCLAQLVIYLTVDLYLRLHLKREPPSFLRDAVMLVVYIGVVILSLRFVFKVDLTAIAVTTTVITAAVVFALQNSLSNILAGFSIQSDKLLAAHNWITIKDRNLFGEIVNVGFRYTTLRTPESNLVLVPNSVVMQNLVVVHGREGDGNSPTVSVDVMLGYDVPPEKAKELLLQVMRDETEILAIPAPEVWLLSLNDSGITYQLRFTIATPSRRLPVQDLLYSRLWYAVIRQGYSFPYPHRQIINAEARLPFSFSRDQVAADLKASELFGVLDEDDVRQLAYKSSLRVFGPGEVVVRQGDGGSSLFIVVKGEMEVMVNGMRVGTITKDSFFGEMSLLTGAPRSATVRASCEVWLAEITKELMEPLLRAHPAIMGQLSFILAERERRTKENIADASLPAGVKSTQEYYLTCLKQFFGF